MKRRILLAAAMSLMSLAALPGLAAEMGDDGLHKAPWMQDTFRDLNEDLAEARAPDGVQFGQRRRGGAEAHRIAPVEMIFRKPG